MNFYIQFLFCLYSFYYYYYYGYFVQIGDHNRDARATVDVLRIRWETNTKEKFIIKYGGCGRNDNEY